MSAPSRTAQPKSTTNLTRLEYAYHSQQGRRKQNEDSVIANEIDEAVLAVVADGMGGGIDGKRFSNDAVAHMQAAILSARAGVGPDQLYYALQETAAALANLRASKSSYQASGTTLVAAGITPTATGADVALVHVGDSRAYVVRTNGTIELLTRDHIYAQQLLREGRVQSESEALAAPQAERLTHALGDVLDFNHLPDFQTSLRLNPGESLVLCSDGISKVLAEQHMASLISNRSAEDAAAQLVEQALAAGSSDNVTALVVRCMPAVAVSRFLPLSMVLLAITGVLALGLGGFGLFYFMRGDPKGPTVLGPTATALSFEVASSGPATSTPHMGATSTLAPSVLPSPTNTPTPTPTNTRVPTTVIRPQTSIPSGNTSVPTPTLVVVPPTSQPGVEQPSAEPTTAEPAPAVPTTAPPPTPTRKPADSPPAEPPPAEPPPVAPPPVAPPPVAPPPAEPPPAEPPPAERQ